MNYEQKYKEALERAKNFEEKYGGGYAAYIFPELKESEDERIRKEIINFLRSPFVNENITDEKVAPWIAYLQKQKDLTTENIYKHSRERMSFWNGQQKEQKPAESAKSHYADTSEIEKTILWLKSLRPSWKPSEEQMKALLNAEGFLRAGLQHDSAKTIAELYEQLKKL